MITYILCLGIWLAGMATGYHLATHRVEREKWEAQRLRDEAWDLHHGLTEKGR